MDKGRARSDRGRRRTGPGGAGRGAAARYPAGQWQEADGKGQAPRIRIRSLSWRVMKDTELEKL